jgi:RNA polymerase sigma-70 factor (ECF subfamily)
MNEDRTTVAVQRYLDELGNAGGDRPAEPIIGALLGRAVNRLEKLCGHLLFNSYRRLTKPPLNLQLDEMLSLVVERLLKAMRAYRPATVRQFFALANQHIRWELNDLARRLDKQSARLELRESFTSEEKESDGSRPSAEAIRMLETIEGLPDDEREVFCLIRLQGMTHTEAAKLIDVSVKTIQRRLNRSLVLLAEQLHDLDPSTEAAGDT